MKHLYRFSIAIMYIFACKASAGPYLKPQNIYLYNNSKDQNKIKVVNKRKSLDKNGLNTSKAMSDPITTQSVSNIKVHPVISKGSTEKKIAEKDLYTPSKLQFKTLKLKGRVALPRVKFQRAKLPIAHADERYRTDFFEKVFNVNDDLGFK